MEEEISSNEEEPVHRPGKGVRIKGFSMRDTRLFYFDRATPMMDNDGEPDVELCLEDKLHLNSKGYDVWTKLLRPIIKEALNREKKRLEIVLVNWPFDSTQDNSQ